MKWDLVIIDNTTPQPYELSTLDIRGIGGTEASVIRIAEGLGSLGAKVAVVQHNQDLPVMGKYAYYLPMSMLDEIDTHNVVMLRGIQYVDKFPYARKFSWHQDVPIPAFGAMRDTFIKHNVTVIAASKWHKQEMHRFIIDTEKLDNPRVEVIYNPVPDEIMIPKSTEIKYYPTKLVWPASPHKGLDNAIDLVNRLVEYSGNKDYRLHIFNPGYFENKNAIRSPYVINHGSVPCKELWQHMSESLCVFYPTSFEETFGCIAAEANALHTPVLTHEIAALNETVSSLKQFTKKDTKEIIETVIKWTNGERPKVWGQERFRASDIILRWYDLLSGKRLKEL